MDFGRVEDHEIDAIEVKFPELQSLSTPVPVTELHVGLPLWGSDHFKGTLYPKVTKKPEFLSAYAETLDVLELNTTYHSFHDLELIASWREAASINPRFKFFPKLPRVISHEGRLDQHYELLLRFIEQVRGFGEKLGMCFLQLPPSFTPMRIQELVGFLDLWPPDLKLGVEVRHLVWFKHREVHEALRRLLMGRNVSWVITDTPGLPDVRHQTLTSEEVFIRFVSTGFHRKDLLKMELWAENFKTYAEAGVKNIYFFIHERDEWRCREIIEKMIGLAKGHPSLSARELPELKSGSEQLSFF